MTPLYILKTKEEYLRRVGDKDEAGYMTHEGMFRRNSKENGQYHSNWLNMMMPRLYLAKSLLREDGVIFISIDDNEVHNLRLLMNEVFGEENFVAMMPWRKRTAKSDVPFGVSQDYEWIVCFAKTEGFNACIEKDTRKYYETDDFPNRPWRIHDMTTQRSAVERPNCYFTIVNPKNGETFPANPNRVWANNEETFKEYYSKNRIIFPGDYDFLNISKPVLRYWKEDDILKVGEKFGKVAVSTKLPDSVGMSLDGTKEMTGLFETKVFSYPKPVGLLSYIVKIVTEKDDIILDFFAGSGTTAHAVMQMNKEDGGHRKFICVQLPELCDEKSEAYKAGYKTIAEIAKERIRRAGVKIREEVEKEQAAMNEKLQFEGDQESCRMPDFGFKVFKLTESNFKQWREIKGSDKDAWEQQLFDFIDHVADNAVIDNMVYELLLKNGKDLNSAVVLKNRYYTVNGKELIFLLDSASQEIINDVLNEKPNKVIALDRLFEGDDQLKTNTALQMRDAGIEFKTI